MTPAARLSAAIQILNELFREKRPLATVLKEWGQQNRYAGSGDRNAVGNLVHDALRVRASAQWIMGVRDRDDGRAALLGMLRLLRGMSVEAIGALCSGDRFAPPPLANGEVAALAAANLTEAPAHVLGDYPEWLDAELTASFGEQRITELRAMANRAPLDLRANALKLPRLKALEAIGHLDPEPMPLAPHALRIKANAEGRVPYVQAEPAYLKGGIEVQDAGSQLAARLAGVKPGMQVLDYCAGGGGKTLALAAEMNNKGQIFATDNDARRLAPIHERLTRAGVRNVQIRTPKGKEAPPLDDLAGRMDLVLVDAPCTGAGTWRRHPDAKWRMRPNALDMRIEEQRGVLEGAKAGVKPGGRLVYITCSLLDAENGGQVEDFLGRNPDFTAVDPTKNAETLGLAVLASHRDPRGLGLLLTPHRTDTDGFFVAVLTRHS